MTAKIAFVAPVLITLCSVCVAESEKPHPAQACAAFDVHVLTQLEDHGRAAPTTGQVLSTAIMNLIEARTACFKGDYALALDRYSRIDLQGPVNPFTGFAEAR